MLIKVHPVHAGEQDGVVQRVGGAIQAGAPPLVADLSEQLPGAPVLGPELCVLGREVVGEVEGVGFLSDLDGRRRVPRYDGLDEFPKRPWTMASS